MTTAEINQLIAAGMAYGSLKSNYSMQAGKTGEQSSPNKGSGMDFDDMRLYQQGDDQRRIDWRASARSQQTLVRTYYAELSQPVCLVIDRQASMRFGSRRRLKVAQAVRVALWFGGSYLQTGHNIAGVLLENPCLWLAEQGGYEALQYLAQQAVSPCPPIESDDKSWQQILAGLRQQLPQGCQILLISDFAGITPDDTTMLRVLGQYFEVKAIRISDPLEQQLTSVPGLQLNWHERFFSADSKRQTQNILAYQQQHEDFLTEAFQKAGFAYAQLMADADDFSDQLKGLVL